MTGERTQIAVADLNDAARAIEVTWGDEHQSTYPLAYLRGQCPCASCRQEREEAKSNPFHVMKGGLPSAELKNVEEVGRYGLRFTWGDGHNSGIYAYDYLRDACPCETCKAARPASNAPYTHGIYIPKS